MKTVKQNLQSTKLEPFEKEQKPTFSFIFFQFLSNQTENYYVKSKTKKKGNYKTDHKHS